MDYKQIFSVLLNQRLNEKAVKQNVICPFHNDKNPSMSLDFSKGVWYCHACNEGGNIYQLAKKLGKQIDDFGNITDINDTISKPEKTPKTKTQTHKKQKYTLENYAEEKKLDIDFLRETFKITSNETHIIIPYFDINNKLLYNKYRSYNKKMWTDKSVALQPYGLWLLNKLDKKDYIFVVEGESDTQTLWQNNIPAIGFPGTSTPNETFFEHLQSFNEIFIVCENDDAGRKFIANIYTLLQDFYPEMLSKTYIIFPEDIGKKDINEIWQIKQDKDFFLKKINILKSIKMQIIVAYQQYTQKKKWFDPAIRTMAIGLLPRINAIYYEDNMFEWDDSKKQYELIKDEAAYYKMFLTISGINAPSKMQQIKTQIETFIKQKVKVIMPDIHYIHCKNTSINYTNLTQKHFSKDYFITNRIPFNYNPDAKSFVIDKLFSDWVDNPQILYEITGYTLLKHYPGNKWFILFGRGNNGKTTYLRLLEKLLNGMHGEIDNVAHVGLNQLLEDRFASARLYNKHLNFAGELEYTKITNTKSLKDLTGEDTVEAQFKFRNAFKFTNYAKLIFATNKVPATTDTTEGFFRRIIIVKFKNSIDKSKRDPNLLDKLSETDMEYLLYKSIQAVNNLYKNGFEFSVKENMEKLYMNLSNPIKLYIDTQCVVTKDENDYIPTIEFIDNLNSWLRKTSQPVYRTNEIYSEMQDLGFEKARVRTYDGGRRTVFIGIRYKDSYLDEQINEQETNEVPF